MSERKVPGYMAGTATSKSKANDTTAKPAPARSVSKSLASSVRHPPNRDPLAPGARRVLSGSANPASKPSRRPAPAAGDTSTQPPAVSLSASGKAAKEDVNVDDDPQTRIVFAPAESSTAAQDVPLRLPEPFRQVDWTESRVQDVMGAAPATEHDYGSLSHPVTHGTLVEATSPNFDPHPEPPSPIGSALSVDTGSLVSETEDATTVADDTGELSPHHSGEPVTKPAALGSSTSLRSSGPSSRSGSRAIAASSTTRQPSLKPSGAKVASKSSRTVAPGGAKVSRSEPSDSRSQLSASSSRDATADSRPTLSAGGALSSLTNTPAPGEDMLQVAAQLASWLYMTSSLVATTESAEAARKVVIEQRAQELSAAEADLAEARERHAAEETMAFYDELAGDESVADLPPLVKDVLQHDADAQIAFGNALALAGTPSADFLHAPLVQEHEDLRTELVTLVDTGAGLDSAISRVIDAVVATKPHVSRAVGGMRSMLAARLENLAVAKQLVDQARENVAAIMELEG